MRAFYALAISICFVLPIAGVAGKESAGKPCLPAVGYYIAARARLQTRYMVWLFGASNLPPGSVVLINIHDFIGTGGKSLSRDTQAVVREDGLFEAEVYPRKGLKFRTNMVCDVVFATYFPRQNAQVLKIVGESGENLSTITANNPQVQDNSRAKMLIARTVVTE